MLEISTIEDIAALHESFDIECKLAQSRDGNGALPRSFWETYSAFANTQGGDVFLGLKEQSDKSFELAGIQDTQKVLDELWTSLSNTEKVSGNVLREQWVKVIIIDGKSIIQIHVPQASRKKKPVYIKGNPLKGTYKRFSSADILQSEEIVRRMMAEQVVESRDTEILVGYGLDDLNLESFAVYRQLYVNRQPDHPWNQHDAQDFLYDIGAWGRDRDADHSGLSRAGLLMFGHLRAIKEAFPNYMLDYQERAEAKTEARWIDRFTLDGTWSGNVFDFYRQVIRKLSVDLKVPFHLKGDRRQDDTLVHKALREALVNTLVHAEYTGRASILVIKRPDMFGFRNPGLMRVPLDMAIKGGESDCRNRLLQDMFRFIGLGENAGSGLPKIYQGWNSQHWRDPALREKLEPSEQTLLELHMLSLVPEETLEKLRVSMGNKVFDGLSEGERLVLVTAQIETTVDHQRMMTVMDIHPRDLTTLFSGLVEKGLIYQEGSGRGMVYFLLDARYDDNITHLVESIRSEMDEQHGRGVGVSGGGLGVSGGGVGVSSGGLADLQAIAEVVSSKKKSSKVLVESTILQLCKVKSLTLEEIATLLNRSGESIRKDYLQPMIKDKRVRYLYPTIPNHPQQAYITYKENG